MPKLSSSHGASSAIAALLLFGGGRGEAAESSRDPIADLLLKAAARPEDSLTALLLGAPAEPARAPDIPVAPAPPALPPPPRPTPIVAAPPVLAPAPVRLASVASPMSRGPARPPPLDRGYDSLGALLLAQSGRPERGPAGGGAPGSSRPFDSRGFPAPDPATLLLLVVDLDGITLTDGLAAYGTTDDPMIPVGELARLLELDVDASAADGRIIGTLGEARRSLIIDLATGVARVGPNDIPLDPRDVAVGDSEIYMRRSALERFLPIRLAISTQSLTMKVATLELLPIQGRLQRQARKGIPGPAVAKAMRVDEPYHLFTPPSFDVAVGTGVQNNAPKTPLRYDIRAGGDLAFAGLQAYLGSDESGRPASARVLLERDSLNGSLLGPLHARTIGVGDVFTPGLSIGPRSLDGRGVVISTAPLDQTSIFNRIDLRGELPLGDDVELYVNDVLRGAQNSGVQGQYEFLNVPLTQGLNVVRIVTYGPRGQRNEETRVINVSGGLLRPGQATLDFGAAQQDQPLVRVRRFDRLQLQPGVGGTRVVANVNYGLTQYLTVSGGAAVYQTRLGAEQRLLTSGLRTSIKGFATQFDVAGTQDGGKGASLSVAGRVLGANAVFRQGEYRGGLIDENNAEADLDRALRRRSEVTVDDNFNLGFRVIPISLQALRDVYADGGTMLTGSARGSASIGSILVSQGLAYQHETGPGFHENHLRGLMGISTYRNYQWQIRSNLDYDITPRFQARILSITADRDLSDTWALRFAVNQHLDSPSGVDVLAGAIAKTKFGDLQFTSEYDTMDSSFRLGLQLNFGLGYNPGSRSYDVTRPGPGSGGSVAFHAFIDSNGDGRYEPGEAPAPNVIVEGGTRTVRTDAQGMAYITGFGATSTSRLLVSLSELDNPDMNTLSRTVEFAPRPGGVTEVAYPIRPTAEVMVSLKLRRADQSLIGLSATRLRLVDSHGVVAESSTEFDGAASFPNVPAGAYRVELDPEQAQRLHMRLAQPLTLVVKPDGSSADLQGEVRFDPRTETEGGGPSS